MPPGPGPLLTTPLDFGGREGGEGGRKRGKREGRGRGGGSLDSEGGGGDAQFSTSDSTLEDRVTTGFSVPDLDRRPCPSSLPI